MTIDEERKRKRRSQEYHRKYHAAHPEVARKSKLKANYGLTPEDYEAMFEEQVGRCAICGVDQGSIDHPLMVDHDHKTGKVRGLLCPNCNHILGRCGDNPDILAEAMMYLARGGYAYKVDGRAAIAVQRRLGGNRRSNGSSAHSRRALPDEPSVSENPVSLDLNSLQADSGAGVAEE